jgi:hypothetical protein
VVTSSPATLPENVTEAIERWQAREDCRLFFLCGHSHSSHFDRELIDRIYKDPARPQTVVDLIDVVLECDGGDMEAAYQLIKLLRSNCKRLRIFVPRWAKSAATFFCLGADEIWMSQTAELGPLDAQLEDPRDPDRYISALEEFQSIDYLRTAAFEALDELVVLVRRRTRMRLRDVLAEASQFATQLMEPLYSQVDPFTFGTAHRALQMSMEYGRRLMPLYAYGEWSKNQIEDFLTKLTWDYPSHSFVIDYDEAKDLGLKVFRLDGEKERDVRVMVELDECVGFAAEKRKLEPERHREEFEEVPRDGKDVASSISKR